MSDHDVDLKFQEVSLNAYLSLMPEKPEGLGVKHIISQAKGANYDLKDVDEVECKF